MNIKLPAIQLFTLFILAFAQGASPYPISMPDGEPLPDIVIA